MTKYIFFFLMLCVSSTAYSQTASISGNISTHTGTLIPNTTVILKAANYEQTVLTDNSGVYLFTDVPTGVTYTLEMERTGTLLNGVSTFDLVQMLQTILALPIFNLPAQNLAADLDLSGTVSVRDVWVLRQLILGLTTTLDTPNWRFVPLDYQYPNPIIPTSISLTEAIENLDFIGVKAGDVSGNASF